MFTQHYNYHYLQTHWILICPPLNDWYPSNTFFFFLFFLSVSFIFAWFVKAKAEDLSCCVKSMFYQDRQSFLCSSGDLGSYNLLFQFWAVTSPNFSSPQQLLPSQHVLNERRNQRTRMIALNQLCFHSKPILLPPQVLNIVRPGQTIWVLIRKLSLVKEHVAFFPHTHPPWYNNSHHFQGWWFLKSPLSWGKRSTNSAVSQIPSEYHSPAVFYGKNLLPGPLALEAASRTVSCPFMMKANDKTSYHYHFISVFINSLHDS